MLVTGGSTGIGFATARRFGADGDRVTIVARTEPTLSQAVETLCRDGIEACGIARSVADPKSIEDIHRSATAAFGPIEVLVNNAGVAPESPTADMSDNDWHNVMATNLTGVFMLTQCVISDMIAHGIRGVILMTGSINALTPKPPAVAYSVSKAGIDAFVRGLAVELGPMGIRVCGVHPGYIDTPLLRKVYSDEDVYDAWVADRTSRVPLARFGAPDEIASVFHFLASDDASYITGVNVAVDGGRTANG